MSSCRFFPSLSRFLPRVRVFHVLLYLVLLSASDASTHLLLAAAVGTSLSLARFLYPFLSAFCLFPSFSPLRTTSLAITRWKYSQAVRAVRVRGIALIKSPGDEHRDTVIEPDEGVIGPLGLPRRTFSLSLCPSRSCLPCAPFRPPQCTYSVRIAGVNVPLKADR